MVRCASSVAIDVSSRNFYFLKICAKLRNKSNSKIRTEVIPLLKHTLASFTIMNASSNSYLRA